jgi:hypothetical protein
MKMLARLLIFVLGLAHVTVSAQGVIPWSGTAPELLGFEVNADLWRATQGDLSRIRITDASGKTVPVLVRRLQEKRSRAERKLYPVSVSGLEGLAQNQLDFLCTVDEKSGPVKGLVFDIPMRNFERKVTIWGVGSDGKEQLMVEDALLADYARFLDLRETEVLFDGQDFGRFRVQIDAAEKEVRLPRRSLLREGDQVMQEWTREETRPLRIDNIQAITFLQQTEVIQAVETSWNEPFASRNEEDMQVLEIETQYRPVTGMELHSSEPLFSRAVTVRASTTGVQQKEWKRVTGGRITQLNFQSTQKQETALRFSEVQASQMRIEIGQGTMKPLQVETVTLTGPVWQLCFIAQKPGPFQVEVVEKGGASPERALVQSLLQEGHEPTEVELIGSPEKFDNRPRSSFWKTLIQSKAFFIFALTVTVLVLAIALTRAVRTME